MGVDRDKAREDRELLEGGYEKFLTAFNKETTHTARISPLRRPVPDIYLHLGIIYNQVVLITLSLGKLEK